MKGALSVMRTTRDGSETAESGRNIPVKAEPTSVKVKESKPWDLPIRFFISFIEALGRCSEDFYVYLPLADRPENHESYS